MKKLTLIAALLLIVLPCHAQKWDTISATNAACIVGTCSYVDINASDAMATVQVTGTFVATLSFEATVNGSTFVAIGGTPSTGGAPVSSATAAGVWKFNVAGFKQLRVRASAYTSGAATIKIIVVPGSLSNAQYPGVVADGDSGLVVPGLITGVYRVICAQNAALAAHTGTVAETVLYTCKLPPLAANSLIRVEAWALNPAGITSARFRLRLGGLSGTVLADSLATVASRNVRMHFTVRNRNATNGQVGTIEQVSGTTVLDNGVATSTIDTSVSQDLVLTCVLGATTDSTTVQYVEVQLAK